MLKQLFNKNKKPDVTVVLSTYNWSSALQLSLQSALQQTLKNIEIIVVGDGCTDNSEFVAKSFNDKRVRFINLPENSGSQALPNRTGIALAKADYIAYLGQDDIWHPTHLENLFATITKKNADYAFSGAILYGPPDTNIRMITGFPLRDVAQNINHAIPPTTAMHKKNLAEEIGNWKPHEVLVYAVDYDFQRRAYESGAQFAHTNKITAFKFPSAWYRDSYKKRDVSRQTELLKKIKNPDFLTQELLQVAKAAEHGGFVPTCRSTAVPAGYHFAVNTVIKGQRELESPQDVPEKVIYVLDNKDMYGFEWYSLEKTKNGLPFRWTGPRTESTLFLNISTAKPLQIEIHLVDSITEEVLKGLQIFVNDQRIFYKLTKSDSMGHLIIGLVSENILKSGIKNILRLKIKTPFTVSPVELDGNCHDKRHLGVAVHAIHCGPQ